jgi:3-oxoacyl-[acyl-carrier protein] reductase
MKKVNDPLYDLEGKKIVVLAGTKGIGYGVSKALVTAGAHILLCSRSRENVDRALMELKGPGKAYGVTCDLSDERSLKKVFMVASEKLGYLDGMVYNTGGPPPGLFTDLDLEKWDYSYRLLVRSAVVATREFLRISNRGASVVYLTSIAIKEPVSNLVLSNSLRMSIAGLSKTLADELKGRVRFNVVLPGYILTDRVIDLARRKAEERGISVERVLEEMGAEVPLGRVGRVEEVANLVLFLLSPLSSYINGAAIPVDGGLHRSSL